MSIANGHSQTLSEFVMLQEEPPAKNQNVFICVVCFFNF